MTESPNSRQILNRNIVIVDLFDLDRPADAHLQLRDVAAAADPELGEEAVVVLKAKQIAAAGVKFLVEVLVFTGESRRS